MDLVLVQPYLDCIGGAEKVILKMAERYDPVIYTMSYVKEKTFPQFAEFDIKLLKPHPLAAAANIITAFDRDRRMRLVAAAGLSILNTKIKEDYDAISAHLPPSEWLGLNHERVCWYCHGPNAAFKLYEIMMIERNPVEKLLLRTGSSIYRAIEIPAVKKIEKICTCSEFTKKKISDALRRDDAEVIYPAVDPKEYECRDYGKFFMCASRIVPEKRLDFAIKAFQKFNQDGSWKLVIAGHLFENERNIEYLKHLREISKGQNIIFEINVSDRRLKKIYSDCYAYLFASVDEDWGIVILEAMASSKPVISINRGGPTISVLDAKTGFLVNSVDEMAEKMRFLADHPNVCEKMGKAGRKRVEQNYTWDCFFKKFDNALKETAKK